MGNSQDCLVRHADVALLRFKRDVSSSGYNPGEAERANKQGTDHSDFHDLRETNARRGERHARDNFVQAKLGGAREQPSRAGGRIEMATDWAKFTPPASARGTTIAATGSGERTLPAAAIAQSRQGNLSRFPVSPVDGEALFAL
jgi:hypothetical protein